MRNEFLVRMIRGMMVGGGGEVVGGEAPGDGVLGDGVTLGIGGNALDGDGVHGHDISGD